MAAADIALLEHTYKSITYTCAGQGLLKDGFQYHPHPEKFFPPKSSKASKSPESLLIEKKPAAWWKAQCAFRGLNQSGSIPGLQLRLKEAKKNMLPELKETEMQLNKEYKKSSKSSEDKSWNLLKTAEQKAAKNAERYLSETFPKGATGRPVNLDLVVLKVENRDAIYAAADKLGLQAISVDAPWISNMKPSLDKWMVVGRAADAVVNQVREIDREAIRSQEKFGKEKGKPKTAKKNDLSANTEAPPRQKQTAKRGAPFGMSRISPLQSDREPAPRLKQTARRGAPLGMSRVVLSPEIRNETSPRPKQTARRGGISASSSRTPIVKKEASEEHGISSKPDADRWNILGITGRYEIDCPKIDEQWDHGNPMTLDIYHENVGNTYQLYAIFHFNVIEGIMRFIKPLPASHPEAVSSQKRKREDVGDEDGDNANSLSERTKYTATVFRLGAKDIPTAWRPVWRYRWRGQETGEGVIQLESDELVQSITFNDPKKMLSGTFKCDFISGVCHFEGFKKGQAPSRYCNIDSTWEDYSEAAYEEARVNRWH